MKCSGCRRKLTDKQVNITKALGASRSLCRKCTRKTKPWKAYQKALKKHNMTLSRLGDK